MFKILKYQNTKCSESVYVEKCLCVYDSLIVMLVFLRSLMSFDILSAITTFEFDETFEFDKTFKTFKTSMELTQTIWL